MPNLKDLPLDKLAASAEKLVRNHGAQAMQYGSGQGWEVLRERITEVMAYDGIVGADPDDVVVTTGSQQALDLVTELFVNPGDVILAEAPSYVGALGVFRARQADVVHVPMDDNGIIPEALVETIRDVRASGRTIKFIYIIPNYHNPAGVTLSAERRPIIAEICLREHVLIVEDQPLRPARLPQRSPAGHRLVQPRGRRLPGFVLEDVCARFPYRLGVRAARDSREAGPGARVGDPVPVDGGPDGDRGLPEQLRLVWAGEVVPFDVRGALPLDADGARGVHAVVLVDGAGWRFLHVGDAA